MPNLLRSKVRPARRSDSFDVRRFLAGGGAILLAVSVMLPAERLAITHGRTQGRAVRLAGNDSGIDALVVGASGLPTPPPGYLDAANELYLRLGPTANVQGVYSPESFWPLTGVKNLTTDASIAQGGQNLATQIEADVSPGSSLAVFGYSQGADVETTAMEQIYADHVPSDEVHFVMLGDPANPDGGLLSRFAVDIDGGYPTVPGLGITFSGPTPADEYPTDIYTYEYDGFADQPRYPIDFLSDLNAILGMGFNHGDYLSPDAMSNAFLLSSDGLTSYHMIPSETLPLLAPLQFVPIIGKPLYDLLEPDMSVLVNVGYGCIDNSWCDVPLPAGEPATFAAYGPFPSLNWGDVVKALWGGLQQGVSTAITDLKHPGYGPSIMDVPALHSLLESAYNMVGAVDPTGDPVGSLTGDQLWTDIAATLSPAGEGFKLLQGAFPGMIPDPPTSLMGILNDVVANIQNDFATLIPIANTVTSLFTTIPGIAASFLIHEALGGNLLQGLADAFAALVGLGPIGLGVGTAVPVVEALAINALNFVELFSPDALQDLAGLLTYIP